MLHRTCVSCATTLHSRTSSLATSSTSCHTSSTFSRFKPRQSKSYATVKPPDDRHEEGHIWPETPKGHAHPSPYDILSMSRTETYSKHQFHSLVKLYHPDRGNIGTVGNTIPHHVRLERYRLVIAAHNILSDPEKRSAYDRFGMGWHGKVDQRTGMGGSAPFDQNFHGPDDPIHSNANWEDWERYYERRDGTATAQQSVYLSNTMFIGLVFIIISCGSAMNYGRAQNNGTYFVEQRDLVHDRAARELRNVRMQKTMGNREDRLEWFIRQREATLGVAGSDPEVFRQQIADRVLSDKQICRSDGTIQQEGNDDG